MSRYHQILDDDIRRLALRHSISEPEAAMMAMTTDVMAMAREIPLDLRHGLVLASQRWFAREQGAPPTAEALRACWAHLERKGRMSIILDNEDRAIRALICVLSDDANPSGDLNMTLDFFASVAGAYLGPDRAPGARG